MRITLADIARRAGVSVTAVSYVLNDKGSISEEAKKRVREAAAELGYLRRSPTGSTIAVLGAARDPLAGLHQAAAEYGLSILTINCSSSADELPGELYLVRHLAGIIVYGGLWKRAFLESAASFCPAVFLGGHVPAVRSDSVWVDNAGGIFEATDRLIKLGHKRLLLLNGPASSITSSEKALGFERALHYYSGNALGSVVDSGGFGYENGYAAAMASMQSDIAGTGGAPDRVTAVIACESELARGLLDACAVLSLRVPDDVSVIVFRDCQWAASVKPQLAALRLPDDSLSHEAVACLRRRAEHPRTPSRRVLIQPDYIDRESVCARP